jgi:hypothetical protein
MRAQQAARQRKSRSNPARPVRAGVSALQRLADASPAVGGLAALQRVADAHAAARLPVQRQGLEEEEEPLQGAFAANDSGGLPAQLRSGVEALSGVSMDGVRVHRGSPAPAQVGAHAYAQGDEIHLAPGQERHLPHEAWHVAQQRQGRVRATTEVADAPVNDDAGLEREADTMGARAARAGWRG